MPYFSVKARAATQIAAELPRLPLTIVQPAYFYTNFLERFRPWEDDSGQLVFSLPVPTDLQMPWTDPMTSLGPMVAANLREPQKYHGHSIPVVNELLSTQMIAQQFSEVTGLKARSEEMSRDELFSWGLPGSMDQWQWDQYRYTINLGYYAPERDLALSRTLDPDHLTWRTFLQQTGFDGSKSLAHTRAQKHA